VDVTGDTLGRLRLLGVSNLYESYGKVKTLNGLSFNVGTMEITV